MRVVMQIIDFYVQGFRSITLGRTLWAIIIIKLIIMLAVLKLFFFRDYLKENAVSKEEYPEFVFKSINNNTSN